MNTPLSIVFASHTFMGSTFVVGSHHFARQLARLGHHVLHVSAPLTPAHVLRLNKPEPRRRFGIWWRGGTRAAGEPVDYVPMSLLPWQIGRRFIAPGRNLSLLSVPTIGSLPGRFGLGAVDLLLIDEPRFVGLERLLKPAITIYRATDLYTEFHRDAGTREAERLLSQGADALVATAEPVLAHLRSLAPQKPSLLLENGVEYELFATPAPEPAEYAAIAAPRLVYVGALDDRFDFNGVTAMARALPSANVVLIGPKTAEAEQAAAACGNIRLLGARPYSKLPGYLQHATVGLLPLSEHPANAGRSPMKLYEYAAAGLPVVARATPELSRRAERFVHLYPEPARMAEAVNRAIAASGEREATQARARDFSWCSRAETLLRFALELPKRTP